MLTMHYLLCNEKNAPSTQFCSRCGNPVDEKKLLMDYNKPANDLMNALIQNPEVKTFLAKKILEMGLEKQVLKVFQSVVFIYSLYSL